MVYGSSNKRPIICNKHDLDNEFEDEPRRVFNYFAVFPYISLFGVKNTIWTPQIESPKKVFSPTGNFGEF